ncbi:MAG TPA: right-handed parallel beta-helix repeat-containing protein [Chitinophagaceae bacterium]|nr:right-handed parallel beta-helix repeat-containing protein [Chitinophagaceae bacterium]
MTKKIALLAVSLGWMGSLIWAQPRALTRHMRITQSTSFRKALYHLDGGRDLQEPVLEIHGDHITVDFGQSVLQGSNRQQDPDAFFGLAILVHDCRQVTIRNLKVRGYRVALLARNVQDLVLENCDLSYNYRQHLQSTQQKEDLSDWLSYHHNEQDEWLRYGAAIYLKDCDRAVVRDCRVTGGQNALMMTRCQGCLVYNNDFSFNSGCGIALYRSSGNRILYNRLVFNVRGYSDGVYYRGQDSAGILVYEQSSRNLFYKNNVTHCGDGFFLWAGQSTMDSGEGGCNDNLVYANDFSYAPTNGIEATFSRNRFVDNRVVECDNGFWGGYSYQTVVSGNQFLRNRTAIAIEHGQQNEISYNLFYRNGQAIHLWSRASQPADWIYAQKRDTRSQGYVIGRNNFTGNDEAFHLSGTDSLQVFGNLFQDAAGVRYRLDSTVHGLDTVQEDLAAVELFDDSTLAPPPPISHPADPFRGMGGLAGRRHILITEWGPYDYRSPILWNTNPTDTGSLLHFDIRGPQGRWRVKTLRGVDSLSATSGTVPGALEARRIPGERTDILIELEYTGSELVTPLGQAVAAGRPYRFSFRRFFQPVSWQVRWYPLDTTRYNPLRSGSLFPEGALPDTLATDHPRQLDYAWWGGLRAGGSQHPRFITVATGEADLEPGDYTLGVTWDDAVRVYVDGRLVLDEWDPSRYNFDDASPHKQVSIHLAGNHTFRVEHLELGGFAALGVRLERTGP